MTIAIRLATADTDIGDDYDDEKKYLILDRRYLFLTCSIPLKLSRKHRGKIINSGLIRDYGSDWMISIRWPKRFHSLDKLVRNILAERSKCSILLILRFIRRVIKLWYLKKLRCTWNRGPIVIPHPSREESRPTGDGNREEQPRTKNIQKILWSGQGVWKNEAKKNWEVGTSTIVWVRPIYNIDRPSKGLWRL